MNCTLDFLSTGPTPPDYKLGSDGDVLAELRFMDYFHRQQALSGSLGAYHSAVAHEPLIACLDVAAATTLNGQMSHNKATSDDAARSIRLFGGAQTCEGEFVGDGQVSKLCRLCMLE